jgi:hypothetical protein
MRPTACLPAGFWSFLPAAVDLWPMPTAAPQVPRTLSRDDIVRLGQGGGGGRPWDFLPVAARALLQVPEDFGLRLITAANFVRLGLKTAASDHLAWLPGEIVGSPEVDGLARLIRNLPTDLIDPAERISLARANLETLGGHPLVDFEAWSNAASDTTFCRASDGNIISRPANGSATEWRGLSDQRSSAARLIREHFQPSSPDFTRPVYVEGIDPPWLLTCLAQARTREPTGYLAPIIILQADANQFLDGLSLADLRPILAAGNITAFVGNDASSRLADRLRNRSSFMITGAGLTSVATRVKATPSMSDVLAAATFHQESLMADLTRRAAEIYPPREISWWKDRFTRALKGESPLRILIPTTRYSTFIQHASRDLARAFESRGHQARILIEPDDSTKFAATAYLTEILDFRPDLIISINYPRAMLDGAVPPNIPYVCWIQDAMPHLFSPTIGAAQGPLDFLVGHLFDELFERHNYPRTRAMSAAIVADETKFHPIAIHESARARFACEVAYVSHQSETPEAQHQRLRTEFSSKLAIAGTLDRLKPIVEQEASKPLTDLRTTNLHELATAALREDLRRDPDPRIVDIVVRSYCQPRVDRLIRHQTLEWAADIADRRGWRLRVYGKGWESHPRLARYTSGPLDHGDDLRSSYQAAAVHLHMMSHALVHQRLIECILSGGFPLCRVHGPERWAIIECLCRLGVRQGASPIEGLDHPDIIKPCRVPSWADAPALMQLASAMQRLDLFEASFRAIGSACPGPMINEQEWLRPETLSEHQMDLWSAFGLLGQSELFMFHSPESLERRVEVVLERPDLREVHSAAARRRFLDRFTYTGFACRLVEFVRDRLDGGMDAARSQP